MAKTTMVIKIPLETTLDGKVMEWEHYKKKVEQGDNEFPVEMFGKLVITRMYSNAEERIVECIFQGAFTGR